MKILQGSVVTQTEFGGANIFHLLISYCEYVPKIIEIGWIETISRLTFFWPTL